MCEKAVVIELIAIVSSCIDPIGLHLISPGTVWTALPSILSHTCVQVCQKAVPYY